MKTQPVFLLTLQNNIVCKLISGYFQEEQTRRKTKTSIETQNKKNVYFSQTGSGTHRFYKPMTYIHSALYYQKIILPFTIKCFQTANFKGLFEDKWQGT